MIRHTLRLLTAVALLAAPAGCARNETGTVLTPTGIRPQPQNPAGGLEGFVLHDSTNFPGLTGPPYPPTFVTALRGSEVVGADTLGGSRRGFRITGLAPGSYTLLARSHAFRPSSLGPVSVREVVRDAGDLFMSAAQESLPSITMVIGQMPGFTEAEIGTFNTAMEQNTFGVWTYPNTFAPIATVPAGTFRFKFLTDLSSSGGNLIGWGGDSSVVLTAPLSDVPVSFGSSPATDLKVTFPASAEYAFTFDERRLTFSIQPLSPVPAFGNRRGPDRRSR